jgi:hypothetical protein
MKKINPKIVLVVLGVVCTCSASYGQSKKNEKESIDTSTWIKKIKHLPDSFRFNQTEERIVSDQTFNVLFINEINSYLSKSGDLSLGKAYAVIDTDDGKLSVGGTYVFGEKTDPIKHIASGGIKLPLKNKFATVLDDDGWRDDMGVTFKYTRLGKGKISYLVGSKTSHKKHMNELRNRILEKDSSSMMSEFEKITASIKKLNLSDTLKLKMLTKEYKELYESYFLKIAEKEGKSLINNKLYKRSYKWWWSVDGYLPVSNSTSQFIDSLNSPVFTNEEFYAGQIRGSVGFFWHNPIVKTNLNLYYTLNRSSNASLGEISGYDYNNYSANGGIDTIFLNNVDDGSKIYVGKIDRIYTGTVGAEITTFFGKQWLGLTGSVEYINGLNNFDYGKLNLKAGIALSLKDNEGKPKVNIQPHYRNFDSKHFVGIGVGVPIGTVMYK